MNGICQNAAVKNHLTKLWKRYAVPKSQNEKRCQLKGGSQEMVVMPGRLMIKNFNNDNSSEFGAKYKWNGRMIHKFPRTIVIKLFTIKLLSQPWFDIFFHPGF